MYNVLKGEIVDYIYTNLDHGFCSCSCSPMGCDVAAYAGERLKLNGKVRESVSLALEHDLEECRKLDDEQHAHLLQMENLESELTELTTKLEFLQNYQNTISDVEGFDRVVSKFQELNQTWQNMANEYRSILFDAARSSFKKGHQTEILMRHLLGINSDDSQRATDASESTNRNKTARNSQWQISTMAESFKQHGHTYLAIINLAAHLSCHPIARTLMSIGESKSNLKSIKPSKSHLGKKEELERVPSVEQIHQPVQDYKERWRTLAAAAMGDSRQYRGETEASVSSEIGRTADSVSLEVQNKLSNLANIDDFGASSTGPKQSVINKVAANKLGFIEQILYDLTLIKDEIEFHTDPLYYNEPGHSFA
ncbi:hypothetical protein DAPPUDRAFT_332872 [Daphnia pulex]|uniref:Uncharacterized protein n=1 Tax=Daphnia pulex TaxID=6669 RepID=E9HR65_DAPPU|nr:hypothetical protein DAPPUDRAFT_332872 [Daphnia pulex]|eukprot:EFX65731.1 hypothetical protein DAPPUDRAFT_332872 [Daphnia pulex]